MGNPEDPLTGVKSFSIGGRMMDMRERCLGMTAEERRWRAQFLKDQVLSHDEPRFVPEFYKDTNNVFRRLWKTPMAKFETFLKGSLGENLGLSVRHYVGKTSFMIALMYIGFYYFKYHGNDWTNVCGPEWYLTRKRMYPDDPGYPNYHQKTPQEFADFGFTSSPLYKK